MSTSATRSPGFLRSSQAASTGRVGDLSLAIFGSPTNLTRPGAIGTPRRSRCGRTRTTRGLRPEDRSRILGPGKSMEIRQGRATSADALRTLQAMFTHASGPSCAPLIRATSMPNGHEVADELVIGSSLAWKRHHDSWHPPRRSGSEQGIRVAVEGASPALKAEILSARARWSGCPVPNARFRRLRRHEARNGPRDDRPR